MGSVKPLTSIPAGTATRRGPMAGPILDCHTGSWSAANTHARWTNQCIVVCIYVYMNASITSRVSGPWLVQIGQTGERREDIAGKAGDCVVVKVSAKTWDDASFM